MPFATNAIDINRKTNNVQLPPELSSEILEKTIHESAIMQLAQRVSLPGSGITIPVITGDPIADWTDETAEKPVSNATFGTKNMTPYKIAVIEPFSNEFRRDLPGLYDALERRLPNSIAKAFDATIFHGTAPGSNFDILSDAEAIALGTDPYTALVSAMGKIAQADYQLDGWAVSPLMETNLLGEKDGVERPLFINSIANDGVVSRLLGANVTKTPHVYKAGTTGESATPATLGFAGDWTEARYGIVDGINLEISDQATINDGSAQINLWQRNMFAVRVEAELGFIVTDKAAFKKLTA